MRRPGRLVAAAAATLIVTAGCGVDETSVIAGGPAVSVGTEFSVELCLTDSDGSLRVVRRPDVVIDPPVPFDGPYSDSADGFQALANLLALGPTGEERARGLSSDVPSDVQLALRDFPALDLLFEGNDGPAQQLNIVVAASQTLSDQAIDQLVCSIERYFVMFGVSASITLSGPSGLAPLQDSAAQPPS